MDIGKSKSVNFLFRFLSDEVRMKINEYVLNVSASSFITFETEEQIKNLFSEYLLQLREQLDEDKILDLRNYTGYNFKNINAILRQNWTYEENGILNDEINIKYRKIADVISDIIFNLSSLSFNFITFRGTDLSSFKSYGVTTLEELVFLKGKYLYDNGFTSTSILRESSYFNKKNDNIKEYNIEIKYKISSECCDGILLFGYDMSYFSLENEYLIDKNTLFYVENIVVDKEKNCAYIDALVIPKKIWNMPLEDTNSKTK